MTSNDLQLFGGNWTEQKLKILSGYIKAYNTSLKNTPFTRVYIDAFAGTGYRQRYSLGNFHSIFLETEEAESQAFLKGSAKIALESDPPFDKYIFIESDAKKVAELEHLREEYPEKSDAIEIEQNDANVYLREYCARMEKYTRAVVFLDPFATEVHWNTVEAIARTESIDTWILFPLMAVNRLLANDHKKACRASLDRIFGTRDWFPQFYRTVHENDIFGQSLDLIRRSCDFNSISEFYQGRLNAIFAGVSEKRRIFINSRKTPLFQLFFAVGNSRGSSTALRIANHLLEHL